MKNMIDYSNLPSKPGCYIYKDEDEKIIYVGKARDLKKKSCHIFSKKRS